MAQTTTDERSIQAKVRRHSAMRRIAQHWQLYAIIALPVVYLIIFHYIPMYGVQIAFKDFRIRAGILGSEWVGLKHFRQFFASPSAWRIIRNTLGISFYSVLAGFPFPIFLALFLNEVRARAFKKTVQMVTYAPYFISTVVLVGLVYRVLDPSSGIVNRLLGLFGTEPINFLGVPELLPSIYVWSGIWQFVGYSAIIYLAALSGVNPELREAATIDGASIVQRIRHVEVPTILPTIVIILVLEFAQVMSLGFEKIYLLQNDLNLSTSEVISTYVYKVGLISADFSFGAAVGLFNSVVNLILMASANFMARRITGTSLW